MPIDLKLVHGMTRIRPADNCSVEVEVEATQARNLNTVRQPPQSRIQYYGGCPSGHSDPEFLSTFRISGSEKRVNRLCSRDRSLVPRGRPYLYLGSERAAFHFRTSIMSCLSAHTVRRHRHRCRSLSQTTTMGNSQSVRPLIPTPTKYSFSENEKDPSGEGSKEPTVEFQLAVPISGDGELKLSHIASWEASASGNSKVQLARTILSQSDIRTVLSSRSARITDQHIFNNVVDFKTGPVTNQKSSGRCWLFATTNVIRFNIMKRLRLKDFQLSQVWCHSSV